MFFKKYLFGDNAVYYAENPVEGHEDKTVIGLAIYPQYVPFPSNPCLDSLIQVAFSGDEGLIDYTYGVTMRNRVGTLLYVEKQTADENGVFTLLTDGNGNYYKHFLNYDKNTDVFEIYVEYENRTKQPRVLEMLSSFSVSGICSSDRGDTVGLTLHRMTSAWSRECRLKSESFSALGLDMSWARYGIKCEKWGQIGSMPNRNYYPFAAIEDIRNQIVWGVQIEAPYSWQLEVYKEKETCSLTGGLADFEYGHWRKEIPAGGTFSTHRAFFTLKRELLGACNALVKYADARLSVPPSEEGMPVLFNEYCTTWGCPSEENVEKILRSIKDFPIQTFVIDCGWYKPDNKGWCNAIGDWNESKALFPEGIRRVAETIKANGMQAGVWFEFEVTGRDSDCFYDTDKLLTRDNSVITSKNRRFLDLRKENVESYLQEKMIGFLKENGFSYLKVDYNDTYGVGCDGAESLGEGGREVAEKSLCWLDTLRREIPELVIENCASGGSRIEPLRMSKVSMCSFSDAHECNEIPLVAANVSRVVPARQIQIWAVLRKDDTPSRTIYSLCAAMMGRICLSGDVLNMSDEKRELIRKGLSFYNLVKDIVRFGDIAELDCNVEYYRAPEGRQVYVKEYGAKKLLIVHFLENSNSVTIPLGEYRICEAYTDLEYNAENGKLKISVQGNYRAGAFLLEKKK